MTKKQKKMLYRILIAAVLTALNLADDLMRAQDEVNRLRRELALLREKR